MQRLLLTLFIIVISITSGYFLRFSVGQYSLISDKNKLDILRVKLQKLAMFYMIPISAMLSLWGLPFPEPQLLYLPLLGILAWVTGGLSALLFARILRLSDIQKGSMFSCGTFTNIGAVGSLVSVLFFGESAIAISALYRLCEEFYFFAVACPVAQFYSYRNNIIKDSLSKQPLFSLKGFKIDPILKLILGALGLGLLLNLCNVTRPEFLGYLASSLMILATIIFLLAIGMGLQLRGILSYTFPALSLCLVKFLIVPIVILPTAYFFGLGNLANGLPLKVVFILSVMPIAMNALIPPSLYGLDLNLANASWIITTFALVIVLPIIGIILPLL